MRIGWSSATSPRAACSARRADTPVPVGERSTSAFAKTQILRLWCARSSGGSVKMVPYRKPRSSSNGWVIESLAFTAFFTASPAVTNGALLRHFRPSTRHVQQAGSHKTRRQRQYPPSTSHMLAVQARHRVHRGRRGRLGKRRTPPAHGYRGTQSHVPALQRRIEGDRRGWSLCLNDPGLRECCHQGNHAVPTHGAVALVVQEQDPKIGLGCDRRRQHSPIHVEMPAWLPHQGLPNVIVVLLHETSALQDSSVPAREGSPPVMMRSGSPAACASMVVIIVVSASG